ncbi:MAG: imidazoleglycerol-phosphate dehydratase [Longimicrobiales bacterium]
MAELTRETRETTVDVSLRLGVDAAANRTDPATIRTGDAFFDHMLATLAFYAAWELRVTASGDLRHHIVEDVAIAIGLALREGLPETCQRYGDAVVVMDDALAQAAVDVGGRSYYAGRLPSRLYEHFFRSLAENARIALHVRVLRGRDRHHIVEAAVKATGLALRRAVCQTSALFSTKGAVRIERGSES